MNDPVTEQPDAWLNVSPWLRENVCKLPPNAKKWSEQVSRCKFMHTHAAVRSKPADEAVLKKDLLPRKITIKYQVSEWVQKTERTELLGKKME